MNTILLKDNDLEINAYLDSLSLHQSFEEDDTEDDEFLTVNPSGSVLQPASNPYNKQKKIAEANETLFAEEVIPKSPQRVKFNKVEKRICYDYFGSSFESDSIKSNEDDESEKESVLQTDNKQKTELNLDVKGNQLQPHSPASKVIVTVSPKKEKEEKNKVKEDKKEQEENSESESEDVCVGSVKKNEEPLKTLGAEIYNTPQIVEKSSDNNEVGKEEKEDREEEKNNNTKREIEEEVVKEKIKNDLENAKVVGSKKEIAERSESHKVPKAVDLEKCSQQFSDSVIHTTDIYPCLVNHSGITIRITGADSIESVESESTENEVQILENNNYQQNVLEYQQDGKFPTSRVRPYSSKPKDVTVKVSNQTFILRGTKTSPTIRSPKHVKKPELGPLQQPCSKKKGNEKVLKTGKHDSTNDKTDEFKEDKQSSKIKIHSKNTSSKSKDDENQMRPKTNENIASTKKLRPKSCVEKESVKVKVNSRPMTAPVKRSCCQQWGQPHLPEYNGLRSEYGLSAEQLMERKRHRMEASKMQKQRKEQKYLEEQQKRKENEAMFFAWLENKRKQTQMKILRNQQMQAESGIKIYPAPTGHLKRTGAVRNKKQHKAQRKCVSLEELLNNATDHEKKTYRIYLGLSFE